MEMVGEMVELLHILVIMGKKVASPTNLKPWLVDKTALVI